jgi:dolichol-phosphate mannosyltransferase
MARRSLAMGALLYGCITVAEAAQLAGLTPPAVLEDLVRFGLGREPALGASRLGAERPEVSVVIPVFDEAAGLSDLHRRLTAALAGARSYELLFVDDGSSDGSSQVLATLHAADANVKVLELSRNFGHQNALSAGLEWARGAAVVLMDADGQDPPELIPRFLEMWREGNEVVYAVRRGRKESWWKRAGYFLFYRTLRALGDVDIPLDAGDFCLMDAKVVEAIRAMPESGRFLRGLRSWVGFRQVGVEYDRPARQSGRAKYTLGRLLRLGLGGILSFSSVPLRLASFLGLLTSMAGSLYVLYAVVERLFVGHTPAGWASTVAVTLILGGAQLIVIGVLGEYLARVYAETKRRPPYVVRARHW